MRFNHRKIENKWQKEWEKQKLYRVFDSVKGKENFYALVEFPYPSGNLHVGHWYAFSVPDIFARFKRMQGYNVLFPIGFDAFGLPAENAALQRGINPRKWTLSNIAYMRKQLRTMGASFDWSREVVTCDPEYYKWTQWIFLQFFKTGLAYQTETNVNWCPTDKTVLANEQVINGRCDRCGSMVEQRKMKQWMLKITNYAEKLLAGLEKLDWPEEIKEAQRNWIGRSEGAEIEFKIVGSTSPLIPPLARGGGLRVRVFTTRPDTIFGATYMVLAPEHPLVAELLNSTPSSSPPYQGGERVGVIQNWEEVKKYIQEAKRKTELQRLEQGKEKTGVELKGIKATNPATKEEIQVWIADYVLATYGTGAIMAVPAHDERDFEFAKKFKLPIKKVIQPPEVIHMPVQPPSPGVWGRLNHADLESECWTGDGTMINSGQFNGKQSNEVRWEMAEFAGGTKKIQFKIRDWVISRQRYWGAPIPVIYCKNCPSSAQGGSGTKVWPAPEKDLPVKLPEVKDYKPKGDGKSPLAKVEKWVKVKCPNCGNMAERETDTMDTFVDSSWYFLRYTDPHNKKKPFDKLRAKQWMPVDRYSGGAEHTTMHLLYSRFWIKAMHDLGLVEWDEPYVKRLNRGLILGPNGQKMSKSRGNVVDPDNYVKELGADTVRMYLAFIGPYNEVGAYPWDPKGILGVRRFLEKVWRLFQESGIRNQESGKRPLSSSPLARGEGLPSPTPPLERGGKKGEVDVLLHKTIKKITEDIESFKFNTAVSALMILVNNLEKASTGSANISREHFEIFLKLLLPFAPHLAEELWHELGNKNSIHEEKWPEYDEKLIQEDTVNIPVQINGRHRATIQISKNASQSEVEKLARESTGDHLKENSVKKVIYVPGKIINFVTS